MVTALAAVSSSPALVVVPAVTSAAVLSVTAVTSAGAASVTPVVTLVVISSVESGGAERFAVEFLLCLPVWSVGSALGSLHGLARYAVEERLGFVVAGRLAVGRLVVEAGSLAALVVVVGDLALLHLRVVGGRRRRVAAVHHNLDAAVVNSHFLEFAEDFLELFVGLLEVVFAVEFESVLLVLRRSARLEATSSAAVVAAAAIRTRCLTA